MNKPGNRGRPHDLRGGFYVAAQLGLLALMVWGPQSTGLDEAWAEPWSRIAKISGAALGLVGGLFAGAGFLYLGRRLSPMPGPKGNSQLVTSGPYGLVRHPIYSGLIFGAFGWALFINGPLTLLYACLLTGLLDRKARYEERLLEHRFSLYAGYARAVARFIPFVY